MRVVLAIALTSLVALAAGCATEEAASGDRGPSPVSTEVVSPRMVELWAPYCSVCSDMQPLVQQLARDCQHKEVDVQLIDVSREENEENLDLYRVAALPTFVFIDQEGQEVARLVGRQDEGSLRQAMAVLAGEECPGLGKLRRR